MWNPASDAWFAGFVDGEGSFLITQSGGGRSTNAPRFSLTVRADEAGLVATLRETFGGCVNFKRGTRGSKPLAQWVVVAREDLIHLCDYLDRFPLRAKKARDYAIWREAVRRYCARPLAEIQQELAVMREALVSAREYVDALVEEDIGPSHAEVARVVGMDPTTVSRAVAGSPLVTEETRARIMEVRAQLAGRRRLRLVS